MRLFYEGRIFGLTRGLAPVGEIKRIILPEIFFDCREWIDKDRSVSHNTLDDRIVGAAIIQLDINDITGKQIIVLVIRKKRQNFHCAVIRLELELSLLSSEKLVDIMRI